MAGTKDGKTLIQHNVRNGQYQTDGGTVKSLGWLTSVNLDKDLSTQPIFGDGELLLKLVNDKGFTGTLSMTARDVEFETDNGMQMAIGNGQADIQQTKVPDNAIYFETYIVGKDGKEKTKKVWLLGVEVSAPSESLIQDEEDITINSVDYGITVKGVYLKAADGTADYIDPETGRKVKVFRLSKVPSDDGYKTFGDTVPVPTVQAAG